MNPLCAYGSVHRKLTSDAFTLGRSNSASPRRAWTPPAPNRSGLTVYRCTHKQLDAWRHRHSLLELFAARRLCMGGRTPRAAQQVAIQAHKALALLLRAEGNPLEMNGWNRQGPAGLGSPTCGDRRNTIFLFDAAVVGACGRKEARGVATPRRAPPMSSSHQTPQSPAPPGRRRPSALRLAQRTPLSPCRAVRQAALPARLL